MAIQWLGYARYQNSGNLYRRWRFTEPVEELGARAYDVLHDLGPGDSRRYQIRNSRGALKGRLDLEDVEAVLPFPLPEWDPPSADSLAVQEGLDRLRREIEGVARAVRGLAGSPLPSSPDAGDSPTPAGEHPSNGLLRLRGRHRYSDGEPYRDWELLVDVPALDVQPPAGGPSHAAAGDILRELSDRGQVTGPFQLRRGGQRIGDPELWQVRCLFEGLEEELQPTSGNERPRGIRRRKGSRGAQLLGRALPDGLKVIGSPDLNGGGFLGSAWLLTRAVPELGVGAGDLVLHSQCAVDQETRDALRGPCRQLARNRFQALLAEFEEGEGARVDFVATSPIHSRLGRTTSEVTARKKLLRYLRQRSGWTGRTESSRIFLVRDVVERVSRPIEASSDDAAIFELLWQASRAR